MLGGIGKIFQRVGQWTWRAWPVLAISSTAVIHFLLIESLALDSQQLHTAVALVTQLLGGLLVLYSIDSTIGIVSGTSLITDLKQYLMEFPLIKRHVTLEVQGANHMVTGGKVRLSVGRNPKTVEEKLSYLQEQIDEIRRDFQEDFAEVKALIDTKTNQLSDRISSVQTSVNELESTVTKISVGGVKIQLLGVMLLFYGAITSYVA
ncbi:MAG: hypothetical protein RIC89_01675 [Pseudomonadales bacterium]